MAAEITDWISAGANVLAAIGTAGALWVGAVTLRRQVNDKLRAQASAISVTLSKEPGSSGPVDIEMRNDSTQPVYGVMLVAHDKSGLALAHESQAVLYPSSTIKLTATNGAATAAYGRFRDSAGIKWRRNTNGGLKELSRKLQGEDF